MLFSADFYKTTEEAKEQMLQYFQSPQEYETDDEGSLAILHKVELTDKDMEYLQTKTGNIVDKIQEIDSRINDVAAGWKTRRMGKVELTIIRLALYEMDYDDTVPVKVAVNEAVELAKKFGGSDSSSFVNGILAKFIRKEEETAESEPEKEESAQIQETEA